MRTNRVGYQRAVPYVVPRREPGIGSFVGTRVKEVLAANYAKACEIAHFGFRCSPLLFALAPGPLTGILLGANVVDLLPAIPPRYQKAYLNATMFLIGMGLVKYKQLHDQLVASQPKTTNSTQ